MSEQNHIPDAGKMVPDAAERAARNEVHEMIRRHYAIILAAQAAEIERLTRKVAALESIGDELCVHTQAHCDCDDLTCGACVDSRRWNRAKENKA